MPINYAFVLIFVQKARTPGRRLSRLPTCCEMRAYSRIPTARCMHKRWQRRSNGVTVSNFAASQSVKRRRATDIS